jgi:hypothetical protein
VEEHARRRHEKILRGYNASVSNKHAQKKCWASCLGGCSDKISREHTITQAMFLDKEIEVSGMPWCVEPKKVGLANLTSKVFCVAHNSALSPVDEEAVKFAEALRESFRLLQVRIDQKSKHWTFIKFPIDGPRMERWFLKTLINATYQTDSPIEDNSLVEIAFCRKRFEPNAGLYGVYDPLEKRQLFDGISVHAFTVRGRVVGATFSFLGFRLLLYLDKRGPGLPFMEIGKEGGGISEIIEPAYHPLQIGYQAGKGLSHAVVFQWPV